ncbi:hypothetical protein J6590_041161 [Homalodisca vitripennis]|nr:hypothetical protein J6590_041161 [Homalodisca vitripennis]
MVESPLIRQNGLILLQAANQNIRLWCHVRAQLTRSVATTPYVVVIGAMSASALNFLRRKIQMVMSIPEYLKTFPDIDPTIFQLRPS